MGASPARCRRTRPNALLLAALLAGIASGQPAAAAPSIPDLLRLMVQGPRKTNFRGKVMMADQTGQFVGTNCRRVVRTADGHSLAVFEQPKSARGTVVVDDGTWTRRYDPREGVVRTKRSLETFRNGNGAERLVRLIARSYRVSSEGVEATAGRSAYRVLFTPRDARLPRLRVWIDTSTGVELRRDEMDANESTLTLTWFTEIAYPRSISATEVAYRFPRAARVVDVGLSHVLTDLAELRKVAGFDVRAPLSAPGGFEFERGAVAAIAGRRTALLRYTNGLSDLTIFQAQPRKVEPVGSRACRVVARPFGENEVDYAFHNLHVEVVGRADPDLLVSIAEGLDPSREQHWRSWMERAFAGQTSAIAAMRDRGLGADAVVAVLSIAGRARVPWQSLLQAYQEGRGWPELAARHRVPVAEVARRTKSALAAIVP